MADNNTLEPKAGQDSYMITLISSDGMKYPISRFALRHCFTLDTMIENLKWDDAEEQREESISVPEVNGETLEKVVFFLTQHQNDPILKELDSRPKNVPPRDKEFFNMKSKALYDLLMASDYLQINNLKDLTCQTIADMSRGKSVDDMRRIYNIQNDFTEEEEDLMRQEIAWCQYANMS